MGALPALVTLSTVPSVPLRLQLGVLLVQLQAKTQMSQLRARVQMPKHTFSAALYTHWSQLTLTLVSQSLWTGYPSPACPDPTPLWLAHLQAAHLVHVECMETHLSGGVLRQDHAL